MSSVDTSEEVPSAVASGIPIVLEHFVARVAERWPTETEEGQSPARLVSERYEIARALLSSPVARAAASQAPDDLVEELWILARVLRNQGPVELADAIDRALERQGRSPCRRLAYIWPRVPGAERLKRILGRNRRAGERLSGEYREARRLFILLNCFDVGPPLLDGFLELCREVGVSRVMQVLDAALLAGREFVTLDFLRRAAMKIQARPDADISGGLSLPDVVADAPEAVCPATGPPDTGKGGPDNGKITEEEVHHDLASALHRFGSFQDREKALPILALFRRSGLDWKTLAECVGRAEARAEQCDYLRLRLPEFLRALREEVVRAGGRWD